MPKDDKQTLPTAVLVTVTPEVAAMWLGRGLTGQRPLNKRHVQALASEMPDGWQLTNDAICLDRSGKVVNGQHRLAAVVASGATVKMLVVEGIGNEAFAVMDRPRMRSGADMVAMAGGKNAAAAAAVISTVVQYERRAVTSAGWSRLSLKEIHAEYQRRAPDVDRSIEVAAGIPRGLNLRRPIAAAAHYIMARIDTPRADSFMNALASGDQGEPQANALRESLLRRSGARKEGAQLAILLKGWNLRDQPVGVMVGYFRDVGRLPEAFPRAR